MGPHHCFLNAMASPNVASLSRMNSCSLAFSSPIPKDLFPPGPYFTRADSSGVFSSLPAKGPRGPTPPLPPDANYVRLADALGTPEQRAAGSQALLTCNFNT